MLDQSVVPAFTDVKVMVAFQLVPVPPPQLGAVSETYMIAPASAGNPKSTLVFVSETENEHPSVAPVPIVELG
jgi:hypothetical protein